MNTFIILIAFVWGIGIVFNTMFDFFEFNIERFYERQSKAVQFILKPTIYCNVCMSSFWGTICYFGLLQLTDLRWWVLHCVICAGVIWVINKIINLIDV